MLARFSNLCLPKHKWNSLNDVVKLEIATLRDRIFSNDPTLSPATSCDAVWTTTREILLSDGDVKRQVFAPAPQQYRSHRSAALARLLNRKKELEQIYVLKFFGLLRDAPLRYNLYFLLVE